MCGFAGLLVRSREKVNLPAWKELRSKLHHRGPDADKFEEIDEHDWKGFLGHVRLRIIDLCNKSDQPFSVGNRTLVFNGEIYNYKLIKNELINLGYNFTTESDTEVVLNAYDCFGVEAFNKFDGMWSVVIHDKDEDKLIFSRDHFGEKPLYFKNIADNAFYFSSTISSLMSMVEQCDINHRYLDRFLKEGYSSTQESMVLGVEQIPPGQTRIYSLKDGTMSINNSAFSPFSRKNRRVKKSKFCINKFESLLVNSISNRLVSDVPISLLLSGGIDSTYIATLAKQELNVDLHCLTICDDIGGEEETNRAKKVARKLGLAHDIIETKSSDIKTLYCESLKTMDEPISDPSYPMLVKLMRSVPESTKVVITGDGADELFLSYSNYRNILNKSRYSINIPDRFSEAIAGMSTNKSGIFDKIVSRVLNRVLVSSDFQSLSNQLTIGGYHSRLADLCQIISKYDIDKDDILYLNAYLCDLSDYLLVKSDRASMAFSKEARSPYLNKELQRYILSCSKESINIGTKDHIISRLNSRLGSGFDFYKRGFFASGQNYLPNYNEIINDSPISALSAIEDKVFERSSLHGYRARVLSDWLKVNKLAL